MNYNIEVTSNFKKEIKKLLKKYPSLKNEYAELITDLKIDPILGTHIGHKCYKIRLAIKSKGKGKSGGARIITHVVIDDEQIYLLSIYDKANQDSITDKQILQLIKNL